MNASQKQRAGRAVAQRIAQMNATPTTVARAAGISPKTLRALMQGERWPTDAVQQQIESVLRWRNGELVMRAVQGDIDRGMDIHTDTELAAELLRRLEARERREARLRTGDRRGERADPNRGKVTPRTS
jgi:transcriptional regulator with XRE-family HTH domain